MTEEQAWAKIHEISSYNLDSKSGICSTLMQEINSFLYRMSPLQRQQLLMGFCHQCWHSIETCSCTRDSGPDGFYSVYVWRCKDDSLYRGQSGNLRQRSSDHINGWGSEYTKKFIAVEFMGCLTHIPDLRTSLQAEKRLKGIRRSTVMKRFREWEKGSCLPSYFGAPSAIFCRTMQEFESKALYTYEARIHEYRLSREDS